MNKLSFNYWHSVFHEYQTHLVMFCMGLELVFICFFLLLYIYPFLGMAGDIGDMIPYGGAFLLLYFEKQYKFVPWAFFERLPLFWHFVLLALVIGASLIAQYTLRPLIIFLRKNGTTS